MGEDDAPTRHGLRDEAIIENILRDYERAVTLDEKNRVGKSLLQFALEVGDDDIVSVGKPEKRKVLRHDEAYVVSYEGNQLGIFKTKEEVYVGAIPKKKRLTKPEPKEFQKNFGADLLKRFWK